MYPGVIISWSKGGEVEDRTTTWRSSYSRNALNADAVFVASTTFDTIENFRKYYRRRRSRLAVVRRVALSELVKRNNYLRKPKTPPPPLSFHCVPCDSSDLPRSLYFNITRDPIGLPRTMSCYTGDNAADTRWCIILSFYTRFLGRF